MSWDKLTNVFTTNFKKLILICIMSVFISLVIAYSFLPIIQTDLDEFFYYILVCIPYSMIFFFLYDLKKVKQVAK